MPVPALRLFVLASALFLLAAGGCARFDLDEFNCVRDSDCAPGQTCISGLCTGQPTITPDCRADTDCAGSLVCEGGACVEDIEFAAAIDVSGEWWMLRFGYEVSAGDTVMPPDVTGVSFTQTGATFVQLTDDDPSSSMPGTIGSDNVYVQTDGDFRAELRFQDANNGAGTWVQSDLRYEMRFVRRGASAFVLPATLRTLTEPSNTAAFSPTGSSLTVDFLGVQFEGVHARDRSYVVATESASAMVIVWESAAQARASVFATTAAAEPPSITSYDLISAANGDGTAPFVSRFFPVVDRDAVQPDVPFQITFSEPLNPDTVNAQTVLVVPATAIDGVDESAGVPMDGTIEVDGAEVTWTPDRGSLFEFETAYEVTFTTGITDVSGEPLALDATFSLQTQVLGVGPAYRIHRWVEGEDDDGGVLFAEDAPEGTNASFGLTDSSDVSTNTHFEAIWFEDGYASLGSAFYDRLRWLESGTGESDAYVAAGSTLFSGQQWLITPIAERAAPGVGESRMRYSLTSKFQGGERPLSVFAEGATLRVQDAGDASDTWWFERVDPTTSSACISDDECGGFACWTPWGVCLNHCQSVTPFCAEAQVCDEGLCVPE